jgi:hypothetical protein
MTNRDGQDGIAIETLRPENAKSGAIGENVIGRHSI